MRRKGSGRPELMSLLMKLFPLLLVVSIAVLVGTVFGGMTVEEILAYTPQNLALAAVTFIGIYTIKSLSVFFPLIVLYASAGMVFPLPVAFAVNLAGLLVCVSVPYGLGRFAGKEWVDGLLYHYKKARELERFKDENEWFLSYMLRVVNLLPGDIVSLFLGATHTDFKKYVCGSIVGLLPTMVAVTVMGESIRDPDSPQFLISLGLTVTVSVVSLLIYRHRSKRK